LSSEEGQVVRLSWSGNDKTRDDFLKFMGTTEHGEVTVKLMHGRIAGVERREVSR
jgi:predicted nucleotidyltransferase